MNHALNILPNVISLESSVVSHTVKKEHKRLLNFIRKRIPTEADAEDILQDVFYQFAANYAANNPIERVSSWLFTVAGNKIKDWYRKRRESRLDDMQAAMDADMENMSLPSYNIADTEATADELMERALFWEELDSLLAELPEEQREVFIRHVLEDQSFKEISEQTQVPVNTLLSRKRYAVLRLREKLKGFYQEIINF